MEFFSSLLWDVLGWKRHHKLFQPLPLDTCRDPRRNLILLLVKETQTVLFGCLFIYLLDIYLFGYLFIWIFPCVPEMVKSVTGVTDALSADKHFRFYPTFWATSFLKVPSLGMASWQCFHSLFKSFNYQAMKLILPSVVPNQTGLRALSSDG